MNSSESPCQGNSNEYPQHMFSWRNKKNDYLDTPPIWSYVNICTIWKQMEKRLPTKGTHFKISRNYFFSTLLSFHVRNNISTIINQLVTEHFKISRNYFFSTLLSFHVRNNVSIITNQMVTEHFKISRHYFFSKLLSFQVRNNVSIITNQLVTVHSSRTTA